MSKETNISKLYQTLGLIALGIGGMFYHYFVITKVWGYIAVKMFGLPPIGLWKAFAIAFLVATLRADYSDKGKTDLDKTQKDVLRLYFGITLAWGLGYLFFG